MGASGGFVGGDPGQLRVLAKELHNAAQALSGLRGRVSPLMQSAWRGQWAVVEVPLEAAMRLADETAKQLDAAAAAVVLRAKRIELAGAGDASGLTLGVGSAGLFVPGASRMLAASPRNPGSPRHPGSARKPTARERRRQGASDAARILEKLKSGFFNLAEPEKARRVLAGSVERARQDPAYAAGFLTRLGPKGLAKLLDDGSLDPCALGEVVARASLVENSSGDPQFGPKFLDQALGKNKGRAAERATALGACECPAITFHPAWTERMVEVLYRGPDISSRGDSRVRYRATADRLITQLLPAGAHGPAGGLDAETENALERLIAFAADHQLDGAGRAALAGLLSHPAAMASVASQLVDTDIAADPDISGFHVGRTDLRKVLAELGADPGCGPQLVEAAATFAAVRLPGVASVLGDESGDREVQRGLDEIGAAFGALTAAPYPDSAVALDAMKVGSDTVKGFVKSLAGAALKVTGAGVVATLAIDGAQTVGFAFGSAELDRRRASAKLEAAGDERERRDLLRDQIRTDLEHLSYVALVSDPATLERLGVDLGEDAFPRVLPNRKATQRVDERFADEGITSVKQWRDLLFNVPGNEGHLTVPYPDDRQRYAAFRLWADHVNPRLGLTADQMHKTMMAGFNGQVVQGS